VLGRRSGKKQRARQSQPVYSTPPHGLICGGRQPRVGEGCLKSGHPRLNPLLQPGDDTEWPLSGGWVGRGWVWGPAMNYALESVTLVTFAAFLAWGLKILIAWT
jgi:hypothetical protein